MPSINFKGKNAIWNYHLSVPYQTLEKDEKLSVKGKSSEDNLLIEADNLVALKSLLPKYQGKIKCIYIDPPYNTGKEGWVYNDNVNSPLISDWIGGAVGADDLTRHDKWLCMMAPRLKLMRDLLAEDGMIFVSIDDNECHHLTCLMNEIFSEENFLATIARLTKRGGNKGNFNKPKKDYVVCYFKNKDSLQVEMFGKLIDVDNINWLEEEFDGKIRKFIQGDIPYREGLEIRKNQRYYIEAPDGSLIIPPGNVFPAEKKDAAFIFPQDSSDKCWSWSRDRYLQEKEVDRFIFKKSNQSPFLDENGKKAKWTIYKKVFKDEKAIKREIFIDFLDKFQNNLGTSALEELKLGQFFENPKPPQLVKYLLSIASDSDSIILDSFAGSGTTAQAVLELNKEEDDSNRKFILIQLPEEIKKDRPAYKAGFRYIADITGERIKRVINKDKSNEGFSYMKLGPQIDAEAILSGKLPEYKEFAKYVYYLATGKVMENEKTINEKDYYVGKDGGREIYLLYEKSKDKLKGLAITLEWAEKINKKDQGKKLVYAPACFLDEEYLDKFDIDFVSIPYNLFEKK